MRFYIHAHDTLPTRRQIISCHVAVAGAEASTTKFNSYMKSSRADSKSTPGVSDISSSSSSTDEPRPRTHMDIRQKKTSSGRGRALNTQGTMRMKYILGFGGHHHGMAAEVSPSTRGGSSLVVGVMNRLPTTVHAWKTASFAMSMSSNTVSVLWFSRCVVQTATFL